MKNMGGPPAQKLVELGTRRLGRQSSKDDGMDGERGTGTEENRGPVVHFLAQPAGMAPLGVLAACFFLWPVFLFPAQAGFFEVLHRTIEKPLLLLIPALLVLFALFVARLFLCPPVSLVDRVEISSGCIRAVPAKIRRALQAKEAELAIPADAVEIVLCKRLYRGLGDGFRIGVRAGSAGRIAIKEIPLRYLTARDAQVLAEKISQTTGLPVRTTLWQRHEDGSQEETIWEAPPRRQHLWRSPVLFLYICLPFAGGALAGWIGPPAWVSVGFGLCVWLVQLLLLALLERAKGPKPKRNPAYRLTTIVSSLASYACAFAIATYYARGH